jgi:hypothetical protein
MQIGNIMIRAKDIVEAISDDRKAFEKFVSKVQQKAPGVPLGSSFNKDGCSLENSISLHADIGKIGYNIYSPEFIYFYKVLKNYLVKASTDSGLTKVLGKPSFEGMKGRDTLVIKYPEHFSCLLLSDINAGFSYYYVGFTFADSLFTQLLRDDFYKSLGDVFRGCEQSTKYFKNKPIKKTNTDW